MKRFLFYSLILCSALLKAQDKLYMLDGTMRVVKILEIAPDNITIVPLSESGAPFRDANEIIPKSDVLLIEYKSGAIEIYTSPQKSSIINANGSARKEIKKDEEQNFSFNFASLNTLALCNADIAGFFEHLTPSKKLGIGCMGAYNFNRYVIFPNGFINLLNNAKKNYDAGLFLNFYPGHFRRRTTFYFGALIKYTAFTFSKVTPSGTSANPVLTYSPANGSQLATIIDVGFHSFLGKNMFIKTIAGIGGFRLKGDYKQQVNYILNQDNTSGTTPVNYSVLPKFYLGLNIGFSF